ncbi:hypothetical protein WJX72_002760 [[Myrmecia] bisecta]|uniref:Uncharacterized protein n=1 Tax=[Myrmecia] bisecta TaxID=41462 RepID=A0AAW1Q3L0_9CHLO
MRLQEYERLLDKLMLFKPPCELSTINIVLFGGVGAGKPSLVSTLDSLFKGRMSRRAPHGQGMGSYTRTLQKYSFTVPNPDTAPFTLWDSAGWTSSDYKTGELGFTLDGNLPHGFDLSAACWPTSRGFVARPKLADHQLRVCGAV